MVIGEEVIGVVSGEDELGAIVEAEADEEVEVRFPY